MGLTRYKLGELLELVVATNADLKYSSEDVKGMTITKEIIPTKANVTTADLSKFIIVEPDSFIYNPRTHGKRIGFGFNNTNKTIIISWNNIAFKVQDCMKKTILSDYLFLHFNRLEWDRQACFMSWGSSTEVFTWEALCSMEVDLPPIEIQQKYVDIYNSMLANQQCYERGLENLKISFEALLDEYKHKSDRKSVGEILRDVDNRNSDGTISEVCGININKQFMPTIADTLNVDLKKYKVVNKGQFAFSGMQTGRDECIRIALYDKEKPIIISPAYTVFDIKDEEVLPEYFMMWFSRKEIDRLGWFYSDASIRTNLDMDRFFEIEVPVPNLEVQKSIVEIYNAYNDRKAINEKLKAQIKDICPILIKGSLEEASR